jgi:hypothetical protein
MIFQHYFIPRRDFGPKRNHLQSLFTFTLFPLKGKKIVQRLLDSMGIFWEFFRGFKMFAILRLPAPFSSNDAHPFLVEQIMCAII